MIQKKYDHNNREKKVFLFLRYLPKSAKILSNTYTRFSQSGGELSLSCIGEMGHFGSQHYCFAECPAEGLKDHPPGSLGVLQGVRVMSSIGGCCTQ